MKRAEVNETKWTVEIDGKEYFIGEKATKQTPEQYFWKLLGNYSTHADWKNHPGNVFIKDETGENLMQYNQRSGRLYVSYNKIWKKIEAKFSFNYQIDEKTGENQEISHLIKDQVEEHFNLKGVIPIRTIGHVIFR